jgi:type IV pilus modification protein PilV
MSARSSNPARQSGSSLIEVLIAMFLVAVTMLGLLGLQLRALGLQKDSLDRRAAAVLVSGFADHITMNFQAFSLGNFGGDTTNAMAMAPTSPTLPELPSGCDSATEVCNPTAAAQRDFALFARAVRARLPDGGAWVTSNRNRAEITVAWRDVRRTDERSGGVATADVDPICTDVGLNDENFRCYRARVAP